MSVKGKFKYGNVQIPMELGWVLAKGKMSELGVNVLGVLSDGGKTIQTILLDDQTMINVWYYYVHEYTGDDWDKALETLDEDGEGGLDDFRENFYKLVVSFSPRLSRSLLIEMWDKVKRDMKNSKKVKSLLSSSDLSEDLELVQTTIPSES